MKELERFDKEKLFVVISYEGDECLHVANYVKLEKSCMLMHSTIKEYLLWLLNTYMNRLNFIKFALSDMSKDNVYLPLHTELDYVAEFTTSGEVKLCRKLC